MATILVIDDDPNFTGAVENMLTHAGYCVLSAADGIEAAELIEEKHNEIDLTIVDLGLPGINGFEIIGALSRRTNPGKIIATTGIYKDIHLEMSGTLGAHAAIRKPRPGSPLPEREWLGTIRSLIGSPAKEKSASAAGGQEMRSRPEPSNGSENKR